MIKLYSKKDCPNCEKLEKLLENDFIYTKEFDLTNIINLGFKNIPVLEINGIFYNYNDSLKKIMELTPVDGKQLMSDSKFYEGYARYLDTRYETWEESVDRVMMMHREYYNDKMTKDLNQLFNEVQKGYEDKLFLGAQRALQFGGEQLLKNNARMYNCSASYCNRPNFFGGAFYLLLSGAGVGFSVQTHHIEKLPKIVKRNPLSASVYIVDDSIEGWANTIDVLLSSYFVNNQVFPEYYGKKVFFDLTHIRPKGSFISGGFKAPGAEPLRKALDKIEQLIENELKNGETSLRPITAYDITMFIADAVISGGVRRSATICMFSKEDKDMINAKTGNWFIDNPQRGRSNNSVVLIRGEVSRKEFSDIIKSVKDYGEPGFIWSDSTEFLYNPCCIAGDSTIMTKDGIKPVNELVGKKFIAIVNGKEYETESEGFWKTGVKQLYKLQTEEGYDLRATADHKILCVNDKGITEWKDLQNITEGESIQLTSGSNDVWGSQEDSEYEKGWIIGNLVGDGTIQKDFALLRYWHDEIYLGDKANYILNKHFKTKGYNDYTGTISKDKIFTVQSKGLRDLSTTFGITEENKTPTIELEKQSSKFLIGYIQGFFDADGSVQGSQEKGVSIRLTQNSFERLQQVQRILIRLGINSKIYKNRTNDGFRQAPDGNGGKKDYFCKAVHELVISKVNLVKFRDIVGFSSVAKMKRLNDTIASYKRNPNKESFSAIVSSITKDSIEDVYDVSIKNIHAFDANGIIVHNCEIGMDGTDYSDDGKTVIGYGFSFCNLTEINGSKSINKEIFFEQCKLASIMGTLQAGYTDFKFMRDNTKSIVDRDALIGVGITGMMNNPQILFDAEIQREGAKIVKKWNKIVADMIGINQAARTTTVKPSGNSSVLLGCSSGIHGDHSKKYFRHVQFSKDSEVAQLFIKSNNSMVETSIWNKDRDIVVAFPIVTNGNSIYKKDVVGVKQLDYVKLTQQNWIEEGTNIELCTDGRLRHNVSNTIQVDNWDDVENYIFDNQKYLCGVSLAASNGDKAYVQAPFTEVLEWNEIVEKYGQVSFFTSALIEVAEEAFDNNLWQATNTALGYGEVLGEGHEFLKKKDFVRRFTKFSKHFTSLEECANCLKDIYNLHKWWKISNNIQNINWKNDLGKKEYINIDTIGSEGCVGGKCEI